MTDVAEVAQVTGVAGLWGEAFVLVVCDPLPCPSPRGGGDSAWQTLTPGPLSLSSYLLQGEGGLDLKV